MFRALERAGNRIKSKYKEHISLGARSLAELELTRPGVVDQRPLDIARHEVGRDRSATAEDRDAAEQHGGDDRELQPCGDRRADDGRRPHRPTRINVHHVALVT